MQSNGTRALVALAAIVLVVVAFFVLKGDEDAGEGSSIADTSTTTTSVEDTTQTAEKPPKEETQKPEEEAIPKIVLADGAPVDGIAELEYDVGDQIRFEVSSDIDAEVHIHGYELTEEVPGGKSVEFDFPADLDGIYEVESHTTEQQIAELRVNP